ncbi:hypothetical protein D3C86_1730050 [compost metagenome]
MPVPSIPQFFDRPVVDGTVSTALSSVMVVVTVWATVIRICSRSNRLQSSWRHKSPPNRFSRAYICITCGSCEDTTAAGTLSAISAHACWISWRRFIYASAVSFGGRPGPRLPRSLIWAWRSAIMDFICSFSAAWAVTAAVSWATAR